MLPSIRLWATRLLAVGAIVYACVLLALLAVLLLAPERVEYTWWLAVPNLLLPHLLAVAVVLLVLLLATKARRVAVLVAVLGLLIFVGSSTDLRRPFTKVSAGQPLRIVSLNQRFKNGRVERILDAVAQQNGDVVAIQELSPLVAAALAAEMQERYPYQLLAPSRSSEGMGLLSRYPFEVVRHPMEYNAQHVRVSIDGHDITLINVHLEAPQIDIRRHPRLRFLPFVSGYDAAERERGLAALLRDIDAIGGPLLLSGDFNLSDREASYRALDARLHDAYRDTMLGFGFSFPYWQRVGGVGHVPVPFPLIRIDYVWSRDGILPVQAHTDCPTSGSDHCLLAAELRLLAAQQGANATQTAELIAPSALDSLPIALPGNNRERGPFASWRRYFPAPK